MNIALYIYLIIGLIFGFWYGQKFIIEYIKKNNMAYPQDMPTLLLKLKQAITLGFFESIAIVVSGLLWPASL